MKTFKETLESNPDLTYMEVLFKHYWELNYCNENLLPENS